MNKKLSILVLFLFLIIACVATNQNLESLSSSYDGKWEGYTQLPEGRFDIYMEIKSGVMSGFIEDTKIKGYIQTENKFSISPFSIMGAQVNLETNFMSPDRIEGILVTVSYRDNWFVVKK